MGSELKPAGAIFAETLELYKSRAVAILVVMLLSTCLIVVAVLAIGIIAALAMGDLHALDGDLQGAGFSPLATTSFSVLLLICMVLVFWGQAATMAITVDEDLTIAEALKKGWRYLFPLAWVSGLYMAIVLTGLILFLVPGLILGISMSLCFYALLDDDLRGMDAVLISRQYIRGHWWNTFGKLLLVWLLSIAVSMIPLIGQVLSIIVTPFLLLYMLVIYRNLKEVAGVTETRAGNRGFWWLMAVTGMAVPILGLVGGIVTIGPQLPAVIKLVQEGTIPSVGEILRDREKLPGDTGGGGAPVGKPVRATDRSWIWHDPTGDTENPLLDIKEVSAKSREGELILKVTLTLPLEHYFTAAGGSAFAPLISFFLDTDVDRNTGSGPLDGAGRRGYERVLEVLLEPGTESGRQGRIHAGLYSLDGRSRKSLGPLDEAAVTAAGNALEIRLHPGQLGLEKHEKVRLCYREAGQLQGSGLAKDKLVPLDQER